MRLLNFGHTSYNKKGFIQSICMAKAGLHVYCAGIINQENTEKSTNILEENQIDFSYLKKLDNNTAISSKDIDFVFSDFSEGDLCILQNEISSIGYIIEKAKEKKMTVLFNPSPYTKDIFQYPLQKVDYLFLNRTEAKQLTERTYVADILKELSLLCPNTKIILTLGKNGSIYHDQQNNIYLKCIPKDTPVIDTTIAGEIFTAYFIYGLVNEYLVRDCLLFAATSANIGISREGIIDSIPSLLEVEKSVIKGSPCTIEPLFHPI